MSHATSSMPPQVLGRIGRVPNRRAPQRRPLGEMVAKLILVISGTVLVGSLGMLLISAVTG